MAAGTATGAVTVRLSLLPRLGDVVATCLLILLILALRILRAILRAVLLPLGVDLCTSLVLRRNGGFGRVERFKLGLRASSKMLGGASQTVSKIRGICNGT
jgi:hypothetical protein